MPGGQGNGGLEGGVKLSDLIPKFDGTTDVTQWLKQLNVAKVAAKITDVTVVMPAFLRGDVFTVFANLPDDQQQDYAAIADALTVAFGVDEHVAYRELVTRRWRSGEPVDVFVADLRRLASLASMPERSVRMAFMNGLPAKVGMQVKSTPGVKAMTLVQVVELARILMAACEIADLGPVPGNAEATWAGWTDVGVVAVGGGAGGSRNGSR